MADNISQSAIDLIVREEVSSRGYYERNYRRPEWPGGYSGITIGIGYDIGQNNPATDRENLRSDWSGRILDEHISTLEPACGISGDRARRLLPRVRSVDVPWDAAFGVFSDRDVPKWTDIVKRILPNTDMIHPDCLGALVSLAYNRGASFNRIGGRYQEMHNIKLHMAAGEFRKIPAEFRSMKRLWNNGLVGRREREAILFERGLKAMAMRAAAPGSILKPLPEVLTQNDMALSLAIKTAAYGSLATTVALVAAGFGLKTIIPAICVWGIIGVIIYVISAKHRRYGRDDKPELDSNDS